MSFKQIKGRAGLLSVLRRKGVYIDLVGEGFGGKGGIGGREEGKGLG